MVCRAVERGVELALRFVPRDIGSAASAFNCFLIVKYSMYAGTILKASSSAKITTTANTMKPVKVTPRSLRMIAFSVRLPLKLRPQSSAALIRQSSMNRPIRRKSSKFNQMKNALPTMFASGTKPQ